jgi:hypothetical protein
MPSNDLASAIAVAVREYVPPASLSSISAAAAQETGKTSGLVDELLGEDKGENAKPNDEPQSGGFTGILDKVVGVDEPPSEEL